MLENRSLLVHFLKVLHIIIIIFNLSAVLQLFSEPFARRCCKFSPKHKQLDIERMSGASEVAASPESLSAASAPKRRQRVETAFAVNSLDQDAAAAAEFEKQHVHGVYSNIAQKFSDTRYKPWPKVLEFVLATPPGGILFDVGCGNGKNLGRLPKTAGILEIGCDRSVELLQFATQRNLPVIACDMMALPFRPGCADRVICIAVLHHLSTPERRVEALRRMFRLLRPGSGRMLIYVWSTEFAKSEIAKGRADPSVLPAAEHEEQEHEGEEKKNSTKHDDDDNNDGERKKMHNSGSGATTAAASSSSGSRGADVFVSFATKANVPENDSKAAVEVAPGRYYHLFAKGELEALCAQIGPNAECVNSFYDCENWAVEIAHRV